MIEKTSSLDIWTVAPAGCLEFQVNRLWCMYQRKGWCWGSSPPPHQDSQLLPINWQWRCSISMAVMSLHHRRVVGHVAETPTVKRSRSWLTWTRVSVLQASFFQFFSICSWEIEGKLKDGSCWDFKLHKVKKFLGILCLFDVSDKDKRRQRWSFNPSAIVSNHEFASAALKCQKKRTNNLKPKSPSSDALFNPRLELPHITLSVSQSNDNFTLIGQWFHQRSAAFLYYIK